MKNIKRVNAFTKVIWGATLGLFLAIGISACKDIKTEKEVMPVVVETTVTPTTTMTSPTMVITVDDKDVERYSKMADIKNYTIIKNSNGFSAMIEGVDISNGGRMTETEAMDDVMKWVEIFGKKLEVAEAGTYVVWSGKDSIE